MPNANNTLRDLRLHPPGLTLIPVERQIHNAGKRSLREEWKMNPENRRTTGKENVAEPGSSYSLPRDSTAPSSVGPFGKPHPEESPRPSKQEDFRMLIERHRKTLDLLAE